MSIVGCLLYFLDKANEYSDRGGIELVCLRRGGGACGDCEQFSCQLFRPLPILVPRFLAMPIELEARLYVPGEQSALFMGLVSHSLLLFHSLRIRRAHSTKLRRFVFSYNHDNCGKKPGTCSFLHICKYCNRHDHNRKCPDVPTGI